MVNGIRVDIKTITPLFLGGADPRGEPELRAASFRGALRFWLRALLGGVLGDSNLDALREEEAKIFGSTKCASPVVVRLRHGSLQTSSFSQLARDHAGISYLFFAARGTRQEPERKAISAGSSFELTLSTRPGVGAPGRQALQWAYSALWLLTHLGGLGARSRRGAGSLQATRVENVPDGLPPLTITANTPKGLQVELRDGLFRLRRLASQLTGSRSTIRVSNPSLFDVLHSDVCKVWVVSHTFDSWSAALNTLGDIIQRFRNRREPDYTNVKSAVRGGTLSRTVERAAFGLPIVFYYRSLGGQQGTLEGERHDRRASPLMLRVIKLASGQYVLVLTLFHAQLLSEGERLKLKRRGTPAVASAPDLSLIEDFLGELEGKLAQRLEVSGW
jgi:CRISPR-associated protein Cmr1